MEDRERYSSSDIERRERRVWVGDVEIPREVARRLHRSAICIGMVDHGNAVFLRVQVASRAWSVLTEFPGGREEPELVWLGRRGFLVAPTEGLEGLEG